MTIKKVLLLSLIIVLSVSCSKKALSVRNYSDWVRNQSNGLEADSIVGDYQFVLRYTPLEYKVLCDNSGIVGKAALRSKVEGLSGFQYFTLEIATKDHKTDVLKNGIQSIKEYYARIQYFSYMMQDDIALYDGDKLLPCKLFLFERDYGLSPYQRFVIAFPQNGKSKKKISDKTLVYRDKVLGLAKPVELTIMAKNLKKIPEITFNKQ